MSEFHMVRTNRLAVAGAGLVMGIGSVAAEQTIGANPAHAQAAESDNAPNLITQVVTKPAIFQYGASLVFKNGQLGVKSGEGRIEDSSVAETASSSAVLKPGDPGYNEWARKKYTKMGKNCPYLVALSPFGTGDGISESHRQRITGTYVVPKNEKTIFRYKLHGNTVLCGAYAQRMDNIVVFPKVKTRAKSGYIIDRKGLTKAEGLGSVLFLARQKK